jgi:cyclophilin family peptidyl-prolyl cis-trans isomerase
LISRRVRWRRSALAAATGLLAACSAPGAPAPAGSTAPSSSSPSSSASAAGAAPSETETSAVIDRLRNAEQRRDASRITPDDLTSRSVEVRRAAAMALARIGGDDARKLLRRALADEDAAVVARAAYGLGQACSGAAEETTSRLVARAVGLDGAVHADAAAFEAIARAVGKCAAPASEPTLVAWLASAGSRGRAAALGLGDLASAQKRLREESLASLLQLGQGSVAEKPASEAFYGIARLETVPPSVRKRLVEVASSRLADPSPYRLFAIKALGRAGRDAAEPLRKVLEDPGFLPAERAEAVRALAKIGPAGLRALAVSVAALARGATTATVSVIAPDSGVLPLAVSTLDEPADARDALKGLASLPDDAAAPLPAKRRLAHVRCAAAAVLAGDAVADPILFNCDPTGEGIGERARALVLGKGPIEEGRRTVFDKLLASKEARTREAALELLGSHPEVADAATILATALAAPELGVVGTAAEVIAKHPRLAAAPTKRTKKKDKKPKKDDHGLPPAKNEAPETIAVGEVDPRVGQALAAALERAKKAGDAEAIGVLLDALGAVAWKDATAAIEPLCGDPVPDVRKRAGASLALLGGAVKTCPPPKEGPPVPVEMAHLVGSVTRVAFVSDVGDLEIQLDPALAPVTVTRIVDLVKAKYFDGKVVHRVVPGFVAQLGAPFGDGWGGADDLPALRCETSPVPYDANVVGMALAGRDTGSSQFFVTLARQPHLDGAYATIGRATGPWESLVEGDRIVSATIVGP